MPGACISPGKMIQFHLRGDCIGFPDVVPDLLRYANTGADFYLKFTTSLARNKALRLCILKVYFSSIF